MNRSLKAVSLLLAGALLSACGAPKQGIYVDVDWDCDDANCDVVVDVRNPGDDAFHVEYNFTAYTSDSTTLIELSDSFEVSGNQSFTTSQTITVASKPSLFSVGTASTRL